MQYRNKYLRIDRDEIHFFRYFRAEFYHMDNFTYEKSKCSLCGENRYCFYLEYSICADISKEDLAHLIGCFNCLQKGRFLFWHDTEIGCLDENGLRSQYLNHKSPPLSLSKESLHALMCTPRIIASQQELWLVHCDDFMAYIGNWQPSDFNEHAVNGNGRDLFMEMTDEDLNNLWDDSMGDGEEFPEYWDAEYYVFQCLHCGKLRGNWDCS